MGEVNDSDSNEGKIEYIINVKKFNLKKIIFCIDEIYTGEAKQL